MLFGIVRPDAAAQLATVPVKNGAIGDGADSATDPGDETNDTKPRPKTAAKSTHDAPRPMRVDWKIASVRRVIAPTAKP